MSELAQHWLLDQQVDFLNHGSFGACPRAVLDVQAELRSRMEREPVLFLHRELEDRIDAARDAIASFVRVDPEDLVFVPNATAGVNTVLRSLPFAPGDELVVTDHEYNASRNALDFVAGRAGAEVVVAQVPFPLRSPDEVTEAVLAAVSNRTRLVLIDHVTSQTGLILPVAEIVTALAARGIDTLVDGAHGPGMLDLDVAGLGAAYYTGNCHKWLCAPKGAAFLWVRRDRQERIRPIAISHGANSLRTDRTKFRVEGDWLGTVDPTAFLSVPDAIEFMGSLLPGGFAELRVHNRTLVLHGRALLCEVLGIDAPAPEEMIGSLASVPLPDGDLGEFRGPLHLDPIHVALFAEHAIEVPVMAWPKPPSRILRISAQAYNRPEQYERLARVLGPLLDR